MNVDCEGCAGCCLDWRAVAPEGVDLDHERRGRFRPLDDTYNLTPLSSDEVRRLLRDGFGDALTPRLFAADRGVEVDGHEVAAIGGRPAFVVGLRKVPKPVAPFGTGPSWLPACVFLDPETLQCRLHDDDRYPEACAKYPRDNLAVGAETECERVENAVGGRRLLDADPEGAAPLFGPAALGATVFAHPDPEGLSGRVARVAEGRPTAADRAEFAAVAAASRPGSVAVDTDRYETARRRALEADSWVGAAMADWRATAGESEADPGLAAAIEDERGAPPTPGWE